MLSNCERRVFNGWFEVSRPFHTKKQTYRDYRAQYERAVQNCLCPINQDTFEKAVELALYYFVLYSQAVFIGVDGGNSSQMWRFVVDVFIEPGRGIAACQGYEYIPNFDFSVA